MGKTVGIIGLGLIGGSFSKTIRKSTDARILGLDIDSQTIDSALEDGAIDGILDRGVLGTCDYLVVALRPGDAIRWMQDHIDDISKDCIIFDVGGVKRKIADEIGALCSQRGRTFVGAHPMAGHHEGGYAHATDSLFDGASFLICEDDHTDEDAIRELSDFIKGLGFGQVVITTPENHDEMIAFTSQLAHIVSSAYIKDPIAQRQGGYSAGSFQDMTRVAILDAAMWSELCVENADMLIPHLDTLIEHLMEYRQALDVCDREELRTLLESGVEAKHSSIEAHKERS